MDIPHVTHLLCRLNQFLVAIQMEWSSLLKPFMAHNQVIFKNYLSLFLSIPYTATQWALTKGTNTLLTFKKQQHGNLFLWHVHHTSYIFGKP